MSHREPRFIHVPGSPSVSVSGFPAAILGYRSEDVSAYRTDGEHVIVPGIYERDLVDWARDLVPSSKQFVDCGAHTGSWTLVMADHFREVHAFEPQRLLFQQLCGNIALNGLANVFTYNTALDEKTGHLTLQRTGVDRGSSSARDDITRRFATNATSASPEIVPITTLDLFASVLNDVGLIKIDVEGLELRVLRGAAELLRNHRPKMLVECWSHDWYRDEKRQLIAFLNDLDYRVVPVNGYADMLLAETR